MNGGPIQQEDEAAIRQLIEDMQEGQNIKKEELFASAFAQEHDYLAINGMLDQDGSPILLQRELDEEKLGSDAVAWAQDRSFDSG
jgi:hypothetical protein